MKKTITTACALFVAVTTTMTAIACSPMPNSATESGANDVPINTTVAQAIEDNHGGAGTPPKRHVQKIEEFTVQQFVSSTFDKYTSQDLLQLK